MEALLYAAGTRQCNLATSFGIREGENRLFVTCVPAREGGWTALEPLFTFEADPSWDRTDPEKQGRLREAFSISPAELEAAGGPGHIVDLVLERVALLRVLR